jgi:hypothetical protein
MIAEIHNGLGAPQRIPCTRVVVYDTHRNPLIMAMEWDTQGYYVARVGDKDFDKLLRQLGVAQTVICTQPEQTPLAQVRFDTAQLIG